MTSVAPVIQWPAVTGLNDLRNDLTAYVIIRFDDLAFRAASLFLVVLLLTRFGHPILSTGLELMIYLFLLALSQVLFFFALRKHFATTHVVPIAAP